MRILLAGATGAIGRQLLPLLLERGHLVTALTRRRERADVLRAQGVVAEVVDVLHPGHLADAVARSNAEVLMHQLTDLANGSSADNARLRTEGTRNLVSAGQSAGIRRIVAQSIAWAYAPGAGPAIEATPLDNTAPEPRSTTVAGVASLEQAVRSLPEWVILRCGTLYGPGTWYRPAGDMAGRVHAGQLFRGQSVTSFLHVQDAAAAAVSALEWPNGPVNICDDEPAAADEWLPQFAAAVGAVGELVSQPAEPWARGASNTLARNALNWTPKYSSWRQGFQSMGGE